MLFQSQAFLLGFLPLALIFWYGLNDNGKDRLALRQTVLILASFAFYAYWDLRLAPVLIVSILVNWLFSRLAPHLATRVFVGLGVGVNLTVLGIFKYADFFGETLAVLTGVEHQSFGIILPLGISFFTFQQIAYLVDLKRSGAKLYTFRDYALFVSFFPQLIAGPIVRHDELIPQFSAAPDFKANAERFSIGLTLLTLGVAKKLILADPLADFADPLFAMAASGGALSMLDAWSAVVAFGFQIYFDFSAYSDMAIGLGAMFGFALPQNFDRPYRASSIIDFWRRWHMTLSRFLRDYLYVPIGGGRGSLWRQCGALASVMLLGGLWHGAAWTFVLWGCLHGIALAIAHAWRRLGLTLPAALGWVLTVCFVFLAWIPFRVESFDALMLVSEAMIGMTEISSHAATSKTVILFGVSFIVSMLGPTSFTAAETYVTPARYKAVVIGLALALLIVYAGGQGAQEFIYFQF